MKHNFSKDTLIRVAVIHVAVIMVALIPFSRMFFKKQKVNYIEMISIGTEKPALGTPGPPDTASTKTPPKKEPVKKTKPKPAPPKPVAIPKPKPKPKPKPWKKPAKKKVVKKTKPKPKPKPKPKKPKEIDVSTKVVTRNNDKPKQVERPWKKPAVKTPTAEEIKAGLEAGLKKKLQTVGIMTGSTSGSGMQGKPDSKYSWYHTLIRETFLKNWEKPQLPGAARLETFVSIRIARDGSVTFLRVTDSSGNDTMDESVKRAARSVHKLPQPLPSGLGDPDYEVVINFRLD